MTTQKETVDSIIKRAVEAGRISALRTVHDTFKATERRLYALPVLRQKLESDRELLLEMKQYGPHERSKSITRFHKSGVRLSPEEIFDAIVLDMEASISADDHEVRAMEHALSTIEKDEYYQTVTGRYFEDLSDESVAARIPCDTSTVWRNRKRLVQRLAVWLYGAQAIQ